MPIEITTPVGRLVWGHPTKARDKINKDTKQKVLKADGSTAQQWAFGIAFDKATFQQYIWPAMAQEASTAYPPTAQTGGQPAAPPKFAWKYEDGDGIDAQGKPFNLRPGYAGCYILSISSELMAPPIFKNNGGSYIQLPPEAVKCGDYVSAGLMLKVNVPTDRTHTPGLYVNPVALEFIAYGEEIIPQGGADPNAIFKGQQHALPPGASATPIGAALGVGMPGMGMQQPGMMPGGQPQPQYAPQPQPMMAPQPQPGYPAPQPMQQPGQPMYAPQPQPMAAPQPQQQYMPPPAPDFVQNAGQPQYAPQPQPQPMYAPQPQPMAAPQPQGQPMYAPQPGMMPGR